MSREHAGSQPPDDPALAAQTHELPETGEALEERLTPEQRTRLHHFLAREAIRAKRITLERIYAHPDAERLFAIMVQLAQEWYETEQVLKDHPDVLDDTAAEAVPPQSTPTQTDTEATSAQPRATYSRRAFLGLLVGGAALAAGEQLSPLVQPAFERARADVPHSPELSEVQAILKQLETPVTEQLWFPPTQLLLDREILYFGSELSTADLLRRMETLTRARSNDYRALQDPSATTQYVNTLRLLASGKGRWPQAVHFQLQSTDRGLTLVPLDYTEQISVTERHRTELAIVGGELESIAAAIEAADEGIGVTLVFASPLGGLSADSGGNMRYFDAMQASDQGTVPRTEAHRKLFEDALGMKGSNLWSIPGYTHERLLAYLKQAYTGQIELVETQSLDALHYTFDSLTERHTITTAEGYLLQTNNVLDTSPEAVVGEKAGLPMTIETLNLGYGLVFDAEGLTEQDLNALVNDPSRFHPDAILESAGVQPHEHASFLRSHQVINTQYQEVLALLRTPKATNGNRYISWGYSLLGEAFQLFGLVSAARPPAALQHAASTLQLLGEHRDVTNFNVAHHEDGSVTFNSLNYHFPKAIRQGDRSLRQQNDQLTESMAVEKVLLETFFRQMLGNAITVRIPPELYVRQQTFALQMPRPYDFETDFNKSADGDRAMRYPLDTRATLPRHQWDESYARFTSFEQNSGTQGKPVTWRANPSATRSSIPGLLMVNKNTWPADLMPCLRILQHQIAVAVAAVRDVVKPSLPDASAAPQPLRTPHVFGQRFVSPQASPQDQVATLTAPSIA